MLVVSVVVVAAGLIVTDSEVPVLVVKFVSPLYTTSTRWPPRTRLLVVNVATSWPLTIASVPVPSTAPPVWALKVTVPVGVPLPGLTALTTAVNVTG